MRNRRVALATGTLLVLAGIVLFGLWLLGADTYRLLQQAEDHYRAGEYRAAATTYAQVQQRSASLLGRLVSWLLGSAAHPARLALQVANSRGHLAEQALRQYQQRAQETSLPPEPVEAQRLLLAARQAYQDVPASAARAHVLAQINTARLDTWLLLLATLSDRSAGQQALQEQLRRALAQAAHAADLSHTYAKLLTPQERMTALLLLEALAGTEQVPGPGRALLSRLGQLLGQPPQALSAQERQRFHQFFFALPLEAKHPWPRAGGEQAGAGTPQEAH